MPMVGESISCTECVKPFIDKWAPLRQRPHAPGAFKTFANGRYLVK